MQIVELSNKPAVLKYGFVESPVGDCLVAWCKEGICALYVEADERAVAELERVWGDKRMGVMHTSIQKAEVDFDPFSENVTLALYGTPFQKRVWRALIEIPKGTTISYSQLAERICAPTATRAVASAVARNEISLLIPCHRVVRKGGAVGQYRWGAEIKRRLISDLRF